MRQTTIRRAFSCSGIGLHSGGQVVLRAEPAPAGSGIVLELPLAAGMTRITPSPDAVIATGMATTLGNGQATVSTVEHFLATVRGLGIDNLHVRVEGGEMPILDGSAAEWVHLFSRAGIARQQEPRRFLRLLRAVELRDNEKFIRAVPHAGFSVDCTIDFPHPAIGRQHIALEITPETFSRIAPARTFGFLDQVEYLYKNGLAKGGSLDNAVVIGPGGVLNEGGLRFADEFVRHKVLDFVGDMAMLPLPVQGHFELRCSGHELHNKFARMLAAENALAENAQTVKPREQHRPPAERTAGARVAA
jgi:UDP-3-O-[3-hydroxymyristoyl] N-acetylglucosamine deacetylase